MDTKLTLKLNDSVIETAKYYAKTRKTSLSKMIENYLQSITNDISSGTKITPLVKSLSGVIDLPQNADTKQDYSDYLINKYK